MRLPLLAAFVLACCGCARTNTGDPGPEQVVINPQQVLEDARALAEQRRYEEALEKHIWFHENAVKHDPDLSAVRLSFALGYWVDLGELYPKAREALAAIRDRGDQVLRKGDTSFELFQEVAAINEYLKEKPKTVELFQALHAADTKFAADCYHVAERDLADQREYALCARYIPDAVARFHRIAEMREMNLKLAPEHGPEFREFAEQAFAEETCRVIAILVGAGRKSDVEQVRDWLLAKRDERWFREAVEKAMRGEWKPE